MSFYDDLNISKNEERESLKRKGTAHSSVNKYLHEYDTSKFEKKFLNKISFREVEKSQDDIKNDSSLISKDDIDEDNNDKNIQKIKRIKLDEKDELYSTVSLGKPASILNPVIQLIREKEVQEKLQKMREHFNINKFLEKERETGVNTDFLGRRKSYLDFLQYTEKKEDLRNFLNKNEDNRITNEKKSNKKLNITTNSYNNISISEKKSKLEDIIEDKFKDNVSFLSSDSNLTV